MRSRIIVAACAAGLLVAASGLGTAARAQGNLSSQGFGYPPGQISAGAAALGGGPAETDAASALNPAALGAWVRPGVYVEYSPEFRSVTANGQSDHTTTSRFPLAAGAITLGPRVTVGISLSTLLDRTWETSRTGYDHFGGPDSLQFNETFESAGAINDVKLGTSVGVLRTLWLGVAADVYSGSNDLTINRTSRDTTVAVYNQTARLSYSGIGASAGLMWQPDRSLVIGVSGRLGGRMTSFRNDTVLTRATAPKRAGAGIAYTGLPGIVLAFRGDWEGWKSLDGLGSSDVVVTNTTDFGGGVEFRGPRAFGSPLSLRIGYRDRGLPFEVDSSKITEKTYSAGVGIFLAQGSSRVDVTLARAIREGAPGVSEHAWTLDIGLMLRP